MTYFINGLHPLTLPIPKRYRKVNQVGTNLQPLDTIRLK